MRISGYILCGLISVIGICPVISIAAVDVRPDIDLVDIHIEKAESTVLKVRYEGIQDSLMRNAEILQDGQKRTIKGIKPSFYRPYQFSVFIDSRALNDLPLNQINLLGSLETVAANLFVSDSSGLYQVDSLIRSLPTPDTNFWEQVNVFFMFR